MRLFKNWIYADDGESRNEMDLSKMKPPITSAQAKSQRFFETVNSLGKMADELRAKVEALTKERDALAERVKASEDDAERYQLLSIYLISDDCQHDDAIVTARTVDQLNAVLAAMKQPKTLLLRLQPSRRSREQVAAPVALTDGDIDAVTIAQWGEMHGQPLAAHRAFARAIEARLGITQQGDA